MRLRECALKELIDEVAKGVVIDPGRSSGGSAVDEEQVDEEVSLLLTDEVVGKQCVADDVQPSVAENHDNVSEVEGREIELCAKMSEQRPMAQTRWRIILTVKIRSLS